MSYTLLLDLDDTLLVNPMADFLPAYLQALSSHLAPYAAPDLVIKLLLGGTQRMLANQQPDCTLDEVFADFFYPGLGLSRQTLQQPIDQFYTQVFPTLKKHAQPHPEAVPLIESAIQRGYRLVVATNPMLPRTAILQRLAWAGLSPADYPFALIPSMETAHFAKPNPAFLAELLAQLDWPEGPVIMVGDDFDNDIAPALALGLPAFWVSANGASAPAEHPAARSRGKLSELLPWLDSVPAEVLQPNFNSPAAQLAVLRSTPAALDLLCRNLPEAAWRQRPAIAEWSITEIICHLRDVDLEVNLQRVELLLSKEKPFLPGQDTDPWAEQRKYNEQDGPNALLRFIAARSQLLNRLEALSPQDWQRPARHAIFGPTTLLEIITIITAHDRLHLRQISQALQVSSRPRFAPPASE